MQQGPGYNHSEVVMCKQHRQVMCTPDELDEVFWSNSKDANRNGKMKSKYVMDGTRPFTVLSSHMLLEPVGKAVALEVFSWTRPFSEELNRLQFLQANGWTDQLTDWVKVKMLTWNPELDVLTTIEVRPAAALSSALRVASCACELRVASGRGPHTDAASSGR